MHSFNSIIVLFSILTLSHIGKKIISTQTARTLSSVKLAAVSDSFYTQYFSLFLSQSWVFTTGLGFVLFCQDRLLYRVDRNVIILVIDPRRSTIHINKYCLLFVVCCILIFDYYINCTLKFETYHKKSIERRRVLVGTICSEIISQ